MVGRRLPFLVGKKAYFQGQAVSFREGTLKYGSLEKGLWLHGHHFQAQAVTPPIRAWSPAEWLRHLVGIDLHPIGPAQFQFNLLWFTPPKTNMDTQNDGF